MNWLDFLACPRCTSELKEVEDGLQCVNCLFDPPRWCIGDDGIAHLMHFPSDKREYLFEANRYNKIAGCLPQDYAGYAESKAQARTKIIKELVEDRKTILNIGPGYGLLERQLPKQHKMCLDQSIEFLHVLQKANLPNIWFVNAFAERMPFKNDYFPCVVSDSVWTVAVDQKEFFIENVRVLKPGGLFIAAINYRWNYPRKPQAFPVDDPSLLLHFLKELDVKAEAIYYDLEEPDGNTTYEDGQYQIVTGVKK